MVMVQVLMTPGCAGCPQAKRIVSEVVHEFDGAEWEEVDISDDPSQGTQYGIMSVPAIVVDGELFATGVPDRDELHQRVEQLAEPRGSSS